jgi:hypothetical protein
MMKKTIEAVAGCDVSVGMAVQCHGKKRVYRGCIFKPWTWLKFEYIPVIKPLHVDHFATVKEIVEDGVVIVKLN